MCQHGINDEEIMMKKISRFIVFFLIFNLLYMSVSCGNKEYQDKIMEDSDTKVTTFKGYYQYPTTDELKGAKLEKACRIEQDVLESMNVEQLAQATIDYPLWFLVASSSEANACISKEFEKLCDAYRELNKRSGAKQVLQLKVDELKKSEDMEAKVKIETFEEILEGMQD